MAWGDKRHIDSFYHLVDVDIKEQSCQGLACFVARHLNPSRWKDALSQKDRINCLGKCYCAPASAGDGIRPLIRVDSKRSIVLERMVNGRTTTLEAYTRQGGFEALDRALKMKRDRIVEEIGTSGLLGRGGAAFPTGRKWRMVLKEDSPQKYVVTNGDEGDPGVYIDRFIMEDDPFVLIEAMAIAGYVIGANKGYIYVAKEYPHAFKTLKDAIEEARRSGFLGEGILGRPFSFDIEMVSGKGSYICGEETALLNSIEGKRPEVRTKPPYPSQRGLFGMPTLIDNVETLANIPWIIRNGGMAYNALGFSRSRGTKVVSLNSLFNKPGLYEVEFGVPLRYIVEKLGGGLKDGRLRGVIVGGPLAGLIPPELFDTPFGYDELSSIGEAVGHGGIVAFDENTTIPELAHHIFRFGAEESCGKCTPCRIGNRWIEKAFERHLTSGRPSPGEKEDLLRIVSSLKLTSLCGHGTGLGRFAETIIKYYGKDI